MWVVCPLVNSSRAGWSDSQSGQQAGPRESCDDGPQQVAQTGWNTRCVNIKADDERLFIEVGKKVRRKMNSTSCRAMTQRKTKHRRPRDWMSKRLVYICTLCIDMCPDLKQYRKWYATQVQQHLQTKRQRFNRKKSLSFKSNHITKGSHLALTFTSNYQYTSNLPASKTYEKQKSQEYV